MDKKKRLVIVVIGIIIGLIFISQIFKEANITGKGVLDMMMALSVSISVSTGAPKVVIDSPENRTYGDTGENLSLNFIISSIDSVDSIWYNLNDGENITITDNTTFSVSEGEYILKLFANCSNGFLNDTESVSFKISNVSSDTSTADANGTIAFTDPAITETIERISGLPVGIEINATVYNDTLPVGWVAPSTTLVEEAYKYFEIDANETLTESYTIFFNLSRSQLGSTDVNNIRLFLYEDGSWSELDTTIIDASSDPLSFSAETTFSQFVIGKKATPTPTGGVVSGGGGAGIGRAKIIPSFSIDQELLKVLVKKGEVLRKPLKITNTGEKDLDFIIDLQNLKNVLFLTEPAFKLKKGEEKSIDLSIFSGMGIAPGVYIGNILIKGGESLTKLIKTIIEIESERVLFDISLDIPARYKTVNPGEEIAVYSTLLNMGGLKDADVDIVYSIKNENGEEVLKDEDTIVVGTQASFTKKFRLPKNLPLGEYIIVALVKYDESVGTSSETFTVGKGRGILSLWNIILVAGVLILLIFMGLWQRNRLKNIEKLQKIRLSKLEKERPKMEDSEVKKRLGNELNLLEKSYEGGYITKIAYQRSKERIDRLLK